MGFFSFNCRGCGHPMLSPMATNPTNRWMSEVVALLKNGSVVCGGYDGYGRVDYVDVYQKDEEADFWHKACWEIHGKPGYEKQAQNASDQGWFFDDKDHAVRLPKTKADVKKARVKADKLAIRHRKECEKEEADYAKWKAKRAAEKTKEDAKAKAS